MTFHHVPANRTLSHLPVVMLLKVIKGNSQRIFVFVIHADGPGHNPTRNPPFIEQAYEALDVSITAHKDNLCL